MPELRAKEPLFNGKTEFDQLDKAFKFFLNLINIFSKWFRFDYFYSFLWIRRKVKFELKNQTIYNMKPNMKPKEHTCI
jgi:hypothetical protein